MGVLSHSSQNQECWHETLIDLDDRSETAGDFMKINWHYKTLISLYKNFFTFLNSCGGKYVIFLQKLEKKSKQINKSLDYG